MGYEPKPLLVQRTTRAIVGPVRAQHTVRVVEHLLTSVDSKCTGNIATDSPTEAD